MPNLNHFHKKTTCTSTDVPGQTFQNASVWLILLTSGPVPRVKKEEAQENFFSNKYLLVL
ncbi:MAG: hypothetical protein H6Q21_1433 [Bacteroidetes bacterium]|nr:hypothetical protein [Bacteroidota bacterium]